MARKPTLHYFLLLFILGYLTVDCILFSVYAASISITSNRTTSLETITKNKPTPVQIEASESSTPTYFFTKSTSFYPAPYQGAYQQPTYSNHPINTSLTKLYKWKKQFLIDSSGNEILQNTFDGLKSTRQLFKETNLEIHEPTNNIALSLNLDTPTQNGQLTTYKTIGILNKYSADYQIFVSDPDGWDKATYSSVTGHKQTLSEFLSPIFNLQNLLILSGIIIFFITSIKISKIILLRKQKYLS